MDWNTARPLVLEALNRAASQHALILKPAEEMLRAWETEPGFYTILSSIFCDHNIDINVRWQAVIYFKNGVDRYWRKNAPNAISEEEKTTLRQQLIGNLNEPVNQVAMQLAVLISKAARWDYPRDWPELLPTLMTAVRSDNALLQHRALLTLHHVTKALAGKRLAGDKRLFQELTKEMFPYVLEVWMRHTEQFLSLLTVRQEVEAVAPLERARLSLKVLRKVLVHGMKEPDKVPDAVFLLQGLFNKIRTVLECRKSIQHNPNLTELCEKFIILMVKVLADVLEHHPFSFIPFIPTTLEFSVSMAFTEAGNGLIFERFTVMCLNLIKGILLCPEYKPAKIIEETKDPATLEAHRKKLEFFTNDTLVEMCRRLVSHYFLLTHEDLQNWEDDPEEYAIEDGGESWKFSLRPCTEVLFLSLFHEFRESLTPVLVEMIRQNLQPCDPTNLTAILHRDAVYNAAGQAAFDLFDEVDFDQWFTSTLLAELTVKGPRYGIVKRRVIWLLGQWLGVKMSSELRPVLYETLLPFLRNDQDFVVRLTTATTIKISVDDFEFNIEQFLPYLETYFSLLFNLLKDVTQCDTKMHVLHVLSFVIERVGPAVRPHVEALVHYLPNLWDESAQHNMLRCAILTTLVHLIQGLGSTSERLYPFLLPVIQLSTDLGQEPHVYLLEEGLELWQGTLENATCLHPGLLQLGNNLAPMFSGASENLRTCFHIIQAYVLLGPQQFLQSFGTTIVAACVDLISDLRAEGIVMIMRLVELVLRSVPSEGPELFRPLLLHVFLAIAQGEAYPMVMSMYLCVMGRVLINNITCFQSVLTQVATESGQSVETLLGSMIKVWLSKLPLVTQMERRKLLGLALATLLNSRTNVMFNRFCGILLGIVEVLNDITKTDVPADCHGDTLILTEQDDSCGDDQQTEHDRRKRELSMRDPVHTVVLRSYAQSQITSLRTALGPSNFQQLMETVDAETMQQSRELNLISV